jgi:hypothetical protein
VKLSNLANVVSTLGRRRTWVGLAAILAGPLVLSSFALPGDDSPPPQKASAKASALDQAELIFRGAERAAAGQRFTLEVFIANAGPSALKDVEFHVHLDAHLEQPSKAREHREKVEAIAADDVHIARLQLTPRKSGPGGMDITLRGKDGATQHVRYVIPVAAADSPPPPLDKTPSPTPLHFKVTPLKECFADRANIVLINVLNTDIKPAAVKELVVSYMSMPREGQFAGNPQAVIGGEQRLSRLGGRFLMAPQNNPLRVTHISLPALEPGESCTLPVRLTPKRVSDLTISIAAKDAPNPVLATARLPVRFDANTPVERLLPIRAGAAVPTRVPKTLAEAPEISLENAHGKVLPVEEAFEHVSHLIEKINLVNKAKNDAYMEALVRERSDVRGLPFTLGDACRLSDDRGTLFQSELTRLRIAMGNPATLASQLPNPATQQEPEATIKARVAAMIQVLEPEGPQLNQQLVKYLASLKHIDATRALAKVAISNEDDQVRHDAVAALEKRSESDFRDVLERGLNYPWPAVAQRTTDAIVKLKLKNMAPQLVEMLERPDPRAPQVAEKDGKNVHIVREMVRVNHLRNCLLCHSPAPAAAAVNVALSEVEVQAEPRRPLSPRQPLTAPVPLPNQTLPTPTPQGGYGQFTTPDTLISFDVTYLRQDFSVKLPVADAQPWPAQQRFDFLVRTREVSEQDAQAYRNLLRPATKNELSPYQTAAVAALRQLTGRDAAPTAAAWRQALAVKN